MFLNSVYKDDRNGLNFIEDKLSLVAKTFQDDTNLTLNKKKN